MPLKITRPAGHEYGDSYKAYVAATGHEGDGLAALERQLAEIEQLQALAPEQAGHRYADGKWSVREVIGHVTDAERVFSYRLLRIARGDETPLPGFDEKGFAARSNAHQRAVADLVDELRAVRLATLALVRSLDDAALDHRGTASNAAVTVRGLVFIIAGHFAHHMKVLREHYGIELR